MRCGFSGRRLVSCDAWIMSSGCLLLEMMMTEHYRNEPLRGFVGYIYALGGRAPPPGGRRWRVCVCKLKLFLGGQFVAQEVAPLVRES